MSKIVTITFNPAMDKSSRVSQVLPESKMRCMPPVFEPGGGGVNISRAIKQLGGDSTAIYSKGGAVGEKFEAILADVGIKQIPISCTSSTRENFIVVEDSTNNQFRFGMPGESLEPQEVEDFLKKIEQLEGCEYLVASGSLPKNVQVDIYARIGEIAKKKGIKYIVDSSEEALLKAFESGVLLAKPNIKELEQIIGKDLDDAQDREIAAREIISDGRAEIIVVSLGPAGAFVVTKDRSFNVNAPSVKKKSTVGAGDSMVAGIVLKLSQGKSIEEAVMYGVACGSGATLNEGTGLCKKEDVDRLFSYITSKHSHLLN